MRFLTFNWDKNLIYIAIYWIFEIAFHLVRRINKEYFEISKHKVQNEYILVIFSNFSDLLSGFLFLYTYISSRSQRKNEEVKTINKDNRLIHEDPAPSINFPKFIKIIIIISLLEYISCSFYWIAYAITSAKSEDIAHLFQKDLTLSFDIFMRYIFSIFILKITLFKHKKCSLIVMGIGFFLLIVIDILMIFIIKNNYDLRLTFYYIGIVLPRGITLPLEHILIKQLFTNNYLIPEQIQFARGIFELIIIVIITPILYYSFSLDFTLNLTIETIISSISYILTGLVKAYILLKVIYSFSAQSVSFLIISQSLAGSISGIILVYQTVDEKDAEDFILIVLEIIGIFITLFATLVYDEVIIINKWKLNENVKLNIIKKGNEDVSKIEELNELPIVPIITLIDKDKENLVDSSDK